MGGFIKDYVNWGGTLKVSKRKNITKHSLNKYAKKMGKEDFGSLSESEQDVVLAKVIGEIEEANESQKANKKQCIKNTPPTDFERESTPSKKSNDTGTGPNTVNSNQ
jgi:hypothetical protein